MTNSKPNKDSANVSDPHRIICVTLFLLGLWGCLAIYNATAFSESPVYYAGKQFVWLSGGLVLLYVSSRIPFSFFRQYALPLAVVFYAPLLLVLLIGTEVHGMKGWFSFGDIYLQPSELAKVPYVLFLTWFIAEKEERLSELKMFLALCLIAAVWILPIMFQPDFGTALIYCFGFAIVYWIYGAGFRYFLLLGMMILPAVVLILHQKGYIARRILGFLNPEVYSSTTGWHVMQFEYTLARGGLWGTDWGKSMWSNAYLPLAYSDSAFASLTEAVGFVGAFPVIIGLMVLSYIVYRMALRQEDKCRRLFIMGMGSLIVIQAFIHISVNLAMIPPTGITLPMISYGGSSMFATLFGFGLILSAAEPATGSPAIVVDAQGSAADTAQTPSNNESGLNHET